jgi:hypothetical protein
MEVFLRSFWFMANKAHAATLRRLSERYPVHGGQSFDLMGEGLIIEVETAATVANAVRKLLDAGGRRFVAMTNQESLRDALLVTRTTEIGVMSPRGDIVKEAGW